MFRLKRLLASLPALLFFSAFTIMVACVSQNNLPAQTAPPGEASAAPEAGVAFVVYDNGTPLPQADLRLYDLSGAELGCGVSDAQGRAVLPQADDGGKLRISAPGHPDREITLPAGLSGTGGEVEYREVTAHKEFSVELPVITGTGYAWQLEAGADAALTGNETMPRTDNLPGGPTVQRLTLKPASTTGQAVLLYVRPWEKDVPPEQWRILLFEQARR